MPELISSNGFFASIIHVVTKINCIQIADIWCLYLYLLILMLAKQSATWNEYTQSHNTHYTLDDSKYHVSNRRYKYNA